ncbi:MAG: carbon storage regulator [Planctomycetaceae bacterium]|nr:carbon storage regulator [Planctomycetaceae bacterium]
MLVLSRKCSERVVLNLNGETVTIEVLQIKGGRVRIGFDAPDQIAVHREELWRRLTSEHLGQRAPPLAG